ncbi:MAG: hypothetical protein DME66_06765 [Verrucomicrobia bacterium]|nr:MAG: hypothetical protein DME66_06765 [Verrucomicrobiota bacterium]
MAKATMTRIARSSIRLSKLSGAFVYSIRGLERKKMNSWSSLTEQISADAKKNLASLRDHYVGAFAALLIRIG